MGEAEQLVRRAKKRDPDAFTERMQRRRSWVA